MEVESALVSHPKVAEAAVIGQPDEQTGAGDRRLRHPRAATETGGPELAAELREHVAEKIGKLARPKQIVFADDLPKTRSGKIMRRLLRDIAAGNELGDVTTLRDPGVVEQLKEQVAEATPRAQLAPLALAALTALARGGFAGGAGRSSSPSRPSRPVVSSVVSSAAGPRRRGRRPRAPPLGHLPGGHRLARVPGRRALAAGNLVDEDQADEDEPAHDRQQRDREDQEHRGPEGHPQRPGEAGQETDAVGLERDVDHRHHHPQHRRDQRAAGDLPDVESLSIRFCGELAGAAACGAD